MKASKFSDAQKAFCKHPSSHAGERRAHDGKLNYDAGVRVQAAC